MNNIIEKGFNWIKIHILMWNNKLRWIANQIVSIFGYVEHKVTINQCIEKEKFEIDVEYEILKGKYFKLIKENNNLKKEIRTYTNYINMFNGHIKDTTDMFKKLL